MKKVKQLRGSKLSEAIWSPKQKAHQRKQFLSFLQIIACVFIMGILNADVVLLLELEVLLPQGVDGVNHNLNQLHLGIAETVLVGDVISVA